MAAHLLPRPGNLQFPANSTISARARGRRRMATPYFVQRSFRERHRSRWPPAEAGSLPAYITAPRNLISLTNSMNVFPIDGSEFVAPAFSSRSIPRRIVSWNGDEGRGGAGRDRERGMKSPLMHAKRIMSGLRSRDDGQGSIRSAGARRNGSMERTAVRRNCFAISEHPARRNMEIERFFYKFLSRVHALSRSALFFASSFLCRSPFSLGIGFLLRLRLKSYPGNLHP